MGYSKNRPFVKVDVTGEVDKRFDEVTSRLEDTIGYNPLKLKLPDPDKTISEMYPQISLTQVTLLDSDATLEDSSGWFYLQSIMTYHRGEYYKVNEKKRVSIMQHEYYVSRPVNISLLGNTQINAHGSIIKPYGTYDGFLVEVNEGYGHTIVDGLLLRGEFQSKGLNVDKVQHMSFVNLIVEFCTVGVSLSRFWYGSFTGQSMISNCLTSVLFAVVDSVNDNGEEVNTIDFSNLDITSAVSPLNLSLFGVANDYMTYGFHIQTRTLGIKMIGVTIENSRTAIFLDDSIIAGMANFSILSCYFENILEYVVDQKVTKNLTSAHFDISSPQININNKKIFRFSQGAIVVEKLKTNTADFTVEIAPFSNYRPLILRTDIHPNNIINNSLCPSTRVIYIGESTDDEQWDVYSYSDSSAGFETNPPPPKVIAPTMQDNMGYMGQSPSLESKNSMYKTVHSPSMVDLSFFDESKGVVLRDRKKENDFYRLYIEDGELKVEREGSWSRVMNVVDYKDIKFFVNAPPAEFSNMYYAHGYPPSKLKYIGGKWYTNLLGVDRLAIGTASEISSVTYPSATYAQLIYNKEIGVLYSWESDHWGWGSLIETGNNYRTQKRALGTTAQRPIGIFNGFIYYDTSLQSYVKWDGANWQSYTP